jgi:hypothetical protein
MFNAVKRCQMFVKKMWCVTFDPGWGRTAYHYNGFYKHVNSTDLVMN